MRILPAKHLHGIIPLPGDKSISHRAAILLAMSEGKARITNFSLSADCAATLKCLRALGVKIDQSGTTVTITGAGKSGFQQPMAPLDCENSGTSMRLLAGVLAGQHFEAVLTGDRSLRRRPMGRVIGPLESMGAVIVSDAGRAPLSICGRKPMRARTLTPDVASAQIKSAILIAGLNSDGTTSVIEAVPTRDHTELMLRWLGVDVSIAIPDGRAVISIDGHSRLIARDIAVPSDISAAAFFMVAAAVLPGSEIEMKGVGINGSRRAIIDVLKQLGADIEFANVRETCNEPVADIRVRGGTNAAGPITNLIDGGMTASLIDELPVLAIFGTQIDTGLEIRDATELRVKESDRIAAVVRNLKLMGADVEELGDGLVVRRSVLTGAEIDSGGDHRIAMAFAIAGLIAEGPTNIVGAECCDVSFPGFFEVLACAVQGGRQGEPGFS